MSCSTCDRNGGVCRTPQACQQPDPTPAPAAPRMPGMFRNTLTLTGPYRPRRRRSISSAALYVMGLSYLVLMVVGIAIYIARSTPTV